MWTIFLSVVSAFGFANAQGFYKVIGPRVVRPNSEYHVAISTQATSVPTIVNVTLFGVGFNGKPYSFTDSATVSPYSTSIVRLEVGDIEPGEFKLSVKGSGGIQFRSATSLKYAKKSYTVFIQTDKAVYKPGHKILFRAIVLNSQLKPAAEVRNEPLHIFISDGGGNKVKEWKNVVATRGVFTNELQLSKSPVLGHWNISVTVHGQTFNKSVEIAQYISPKFKVGIQTPQHMTFKENVLVAHIQTAYNYGKKVKGDATVTVYPTIYSGVIQPIFQNPIRKVFPIDGSATVEFDVANELKLSDEYERTVIVDVTIEEELTGRRQNNSVEVHLHKYDYKMELVKTADYYKPGLKYTAFVKVLNNDGTPIKTNKNFVTVRHGYSRLNEVYQVEQHTLDKNGVIKLEFYPPSNSTNETALRIEAEYEDLKERIPPIPAAVSSSNTFLQASLETDRAIVNLDVEVLINCTEPMKYINYELLGRGDVLIAHTFRINNQKEYKFHFTATHAMVPISHLLVNYVRSDGELVTDSLDIEIDGLLQNFIDVQMNTVETRPETDIDLTIRSQPNSYIGLLAVDQNVGHVRPGYDITYKHVSEELRLYDMAEMSPYYTIMKDSKSHFFWKPGSSNAQDTYTNSGAVLLTNSFVPSHRPTLEDIYLRPVSYGSSTVKPDRGVGLNFHTITRPPLAGPYAFSRIPRPVWDKPKVYLTEDIADTWLFTNFSSGIEGKTSIRRKIPPTLNTWVITGFSLDPLHGLGLLSSPKKLKVSKIFSVTLDLPYSIQRGEILAVPIVVYNHMSKDTIAEITLYNPEQKFEFAEISNEINATRKIELYRRKKVNVKRNSGASVSFMISPLKLGPIEIKATASTASAQDSTTKQLLVLPEGETQHYSKTLLIDLRKTNSFKGNITIDIPKNVVTDSLSIEVSAVGDLLGPVIINLERLIRIPTGCGEQNLVNFIPNLIILNYLRNTGQLTPTIQNEAVSNLETNYQQQLSYKRPDGSFSVFGQRNSNGSVWLTAYVASAFKQARRYIFVDNNIINNALKWLADKQAANGSFVETAPAIHQDMQSNSGKSLALTAFSTLAFIDNQKTSVSHTNIINKALDYIARNLDEEESIYTTAVCSYVLQITKHPSRQSAFNLLESKAKTAKNTKWWGKDVPQNEAKNPWNSLPKSLDIETTSYALLTFLEANLLEDAVPVINWLVDKQNSIGGFTSSQDTVMGLYALYTLVNKFSAGSNMQVEFEYRKQEKSKFNINRDNAMIVQKIKVNNDARQVNVTAQGSGFALFRVAYQFNSNVTGPWPMFTLDPQVDKNSNSHHLQLSICTAFVSRNLTSTPASNMAVMEVNFPSGFTTDVDSLPSLEVSQNVQLVETKNGDTTVVLYFNNLTIQEYCPTVSAFRTHKVAKQRPISVVVYDYYDSSRRARIFYKGRIATLCDICEEEEDCGDICTSINSQKAGESREGGGSSSISASFVCVVALFLAALSHPSSF